MSEDRGKKHPNLHETIREIRNGSIRNTTGFVIPLVGLRLAAQMPLRGFAFWGTCIAGAGLLFLTLPETGRHGACQRL